MDKVRQIGTVIQLAGSAVSIWGIALYSPRAAVIFGGVILTLYGIALERDSAQ